MVMECYQPDVDCLWDDLARAQCNGMIEIDIGFAGVHAVKRMVYRVGISRYIVLFVFTMVIN